MARQRPGARSAPPRLPRPAGGSGITSACGTTRPARSTWRPCSGWPDRGNYPGCTRFRPISGTGRGPGAWKGCSDRAFPSPLYSGEGPGGGGGGGFLGGGPPPPLGGGGGGGGGGAGGRVGVSEGVGVFAATP